MVSKDEMSVGCSWRHAWVFDAIIIMCFCSSSRALGKLKHCVNGTISTIWLERLTKTNFMIPITSANIFERFCALDGIAEYARSDSCSSGSAL